MNDSTPGCLLALSGTLACIAFGMLSTPANGVLLAAVLLLAAAIMTAAGNR